MPDIVRINENVKYNDRKGSRKLSFEKGEVFNGKITSKGEGSEVVLRLSDGWQFPAKLEGNYDELQDKNSKFQVIGFEDGKIKIKVVPNDVKDEKQTSTSIEELIKSSNFGLNKSDVETLKNMLRHDIPLTKENISEVKSMILFKNKIASNENYSNEFIFKYLTMKNVSPESTQGKLIVDSLEKFFGELKNMDNDELLTIFENDIKFSGDELKSFNKVIKGENVIYNSLREFGKAVENNNYGNKDNPELTTFKGEKPIYKGFEELCKDTEDSNYVNKDNSKLIVPKDINDQQINNMKSITLEENIEQDLVGNKPQKIVEGKTISINEAKAAIEEATSKGNGTYKIEALSDKELGYINFNLFDGEEIKGKGVEQLIQKNPQSNMSQGENLTPKTSENFFKGQPLNIEQSSDSGVKNNINKSLLKGVFDLTNTDIKNGELVKNQISLKIDDMKTIIKEIISDGKGISNQLINTFKETFKDFKTFNTLANQYYMLDIPIEINKEKYGCKLLIKDDRNSGKAIDKKKLKIVASVKTVNMGYVDAYISIVNKSLKIDLKAEKPWVDALSIGKNKIVNILDDLGYNTNVNVEQRIVEANIVTTRKFFDDNKFVGINIKV